MVVACWIVDDSHEGTRFGPSAQFSVKAIYVLTRVPEKCRPRTLYLWNNASTFSASLESETDLSGCRLARLLGGCPSSVPRTTGERRLTVPSGSRTDRALSTARRGSGENQVSPHHPAAATLVFRAPPLEEFVPALRLGVLGVLDLQPRRGAAIGAIRPLCPLRDDAFKITLARHGNRSQPRSSM